MKKIIKGILGGFLGITIITAGIMTYLSAEEENQQKELELKKQKEEKEIEEAKQKRLKDNEYKSHTFNQNEEKHLIETLQKENLIHLDKKEEIKIELDKKEEQKIEINKKEEIKTDALTSYLNSLEDTKYLKEIIGDYFEAKYCKKDFKKYITADDILKLHNTKTLDLLILNYKNHKEVYYNMISDFRIVNCGQNYIKEKTYTIDLNKEIFKEENTKEEKEVLEYIKEQKKDDDLIEPTPKEAVKEPAIKEPVKQERKTTGKEELKKIF